MKDGTVLDRMEVVESDITKLKVDAIVNAVPRSHTQVGLQRLMQLHLCKPIQGLTA